MAYAPRIQERFEAPRHAGCLDTSSPHVGAGLAGSPDIGAVVQMHIHVALPSQITQACFKTWGCGASIAASDWVAQALQGQTLEQAAALQASAVAQALELPPMKMYSALLAIDAARAAIADYRSKQTACA